MKKKGNLANNFFFFSRLVWRKVKGGSIPLTVIFNLTNRCNSRCQHCYASYFKKTTKGEMTTQQIKKLLQDLKKNGCLRINFSGGEPLLRKDFGELIAFAKSLGLRTDLTSNGILVSQKISELKNLDSLLISLDGKPKHHDSLRGKGSSLKTLEAIKKARQAGISVNVNTVITKYNLNDIDYLIDLAKILGFKIQFSLPISPLLTKNALTIKPTNEEIKTVLKKIISQKKKGGPILFSAAAYESVLKTWPDFKIEGVFGRQTVQGIPPCPAGKIFGLVDADGRLWPCPHLIGKTKAKNAMIVGIAEAWKAAKIHPCRGCYQIYHHEFGLLLNLDFSVIWNYFKLAVGLN